MRASRKASEANRQRAGGGHAEDETVGLGKAAWGACVGAARTRRPMRAIGVLTATAHRAGVL